MSVDTIWQVVGAASFALLITLVYVDFRKGPMSERVARKIEREIARQELLHAGDDDPYRIWVDGYLSGLAKAASIARGES